MVIFLSLTSFAHFCDSLALNEDNIPQSTFSELLRDPQVFNYQGNSLTEVDIHDMIHFQKAIRLPSLKNNPDATVQKDKTRSEGMGIPVSPSRDSVLYIRFIPIPVLDVLTN